MEFAHKKITLMGLGLLGRGLGDARFFAERGAEVIVTDLKTEAELAPSVAALAGFSNIAFHLGGHRMEDFENRDLIVRAPNAPLDSPFIARARERGIPVEMDAALFVKLCRERFGDAAASGGGITIAGVTGTRGKSTVTQLIYEMARAAETDLAAADKNGGESGGRVHLGGNVPDTATLPLIDAVRPGDTVILELDSWQLQGFAEDQLSPRIAAWTNFMPDHMNYYRGDMDRYFADKAAIARFQKPGDWFVAPRDIKERIETRFGALAGNYAEPADLAGWEVALPGDHNRADAAIAAAAADRLGIPQNIIAAVLRTFTGLPNRLERLGEKNGIVFYNDSNATTPQATIAALSTLSAAGRPIILIAGGSDKELDFDGLARAIPTQTKRLVLIRGSATEKLKLLLPAGIAPADEASDMAAAFRAALAAAAPGDTILLSPGATSFGVFKNEYDRGDQFRACFEHLPEG